MTHIDEAVEILRLLGLPEKQQNDRSALTLLALAGLGPDDPWTATSQQLLRTVDIMEFMRDQYGKDYKPNSRETIRRQTLHQFEDARIADRNPDDPSRPTNSGKNCYALSEAAASVLRRYGSNQFRSAARKFTRELGSLRTAYARRRTSRAVPLQLPDGSRYQLSPGKHNELQVAVIEQMGPRFAPGARVLYVGDTAQKDLCRDTVRLKRLGIELTDHDKLPDVLLLLGAKNWLFLVEAVTSHGPVDPKRYAQLESMLNECSAEAIYGTAFLTRKDFRKYAADIAWETEVWIAETPGHMIHFNGPKFLGPYPNE